MEQLSRRKFIGLGLAGAAALKMPDAFAQSERGNKLSSMKIDKIFDGLLDQNGKPVSARELNGQYNILEFGFAECETICPIMLPHTSRGLEQFEDKYGDALNIRPLMVTSNPLGDHASAFLKIKFGKNPHPAYEGKPQHENFTALTAQTYAQKRSEDPAVQAAVKERQAQIVGILDQFEAMLMNPQHANHHHHMHHSSDAYLIRPDGSLATYINEEGREVASLLEAMESPERFMRDLETALQRDGVTLTPKIACTAEPTR